MLQRYLDLVDKGVLTLDPAQQAAARELDRLSADLREYHPGRKKLFSGPVPPPKGLYLWGGVGRGKSLLMDLFFNQVAISGKRRVHFHAFMSGIHEMMADWRDMDNRTRRRQPHYQKKHDIDDPVPHVAQAAFDRGWLLCFDEFQVTDIADAMLLGRLFEELFELGAVVVATSNRIPDDLYKDGINRQLFLPFIALLNDRLVVHHLESDTDYRLRQLAGAPVYYQPLNAGTAVAIDAAWEKMICGATPVPVTHKVRGHELFLPRVARSVVRAEFSELCEKALGAEDYLLLARTYQTLFLDNIPKMDMGRRNEAKRFVTLIDALYEHRTKLICSADAPPEELYPAGDGSFEFERTASRLVEMQSADYLAEEHIVTDETAA